jgi:transcriptional regulator with XRE-family HTH domain
VNNVVKLKGKARPLVHLVDSPVAIKLLQEELLASHQFYKAIATKAQVSSSTVSNIASGQTRWPRLETIIRILSALGWTVMAQKQEDHE